MKNLSPKSAAFDENLKLGEQSSSFWLSLPCKALVVRKDTLPMVVDA